MISKEPVQHKLYAAALFVVIGIVPLIVRIIQRPIPPELLSLYGSETYGDAFAYWKGVVMLAAAGLIVIYSISEVLLSGKLPDIRHGIRNPIIALGGAFALLLILSALGSNFTRTAWFGAVDRYEGAFIWLAYLTVFFCACFYAARKNPLRPVLYGLIFSSVLMGAIGAGQLIGRDFFSTNFAQSLISLGVAIERIDIMFEIAHGTLYNPNTFGKYTAFLTPVLMLCGLYFDKKNPARYAMWLGAALMAVGVFASGSAGGVVGVAAALGTLLVVSISRSVLYGINRRVAGFAAAACFCVIIAFLAITPLNFRAIHIFSRLRDAALADMVHVLRLDFSDASFTALSGDTELLSVHVDHMLGGDWLRAYAPDGSRISLPGGVAIDHPGSDQAAPPATSYQIPIQNAPNIYLDLYGDFFILRWFWFAPVLLTHQEDVIWGLNLHGDVFDMSAAADAVGFSGREAWGSNRGYIFSRTFALMPGSFFMGSGPDTFTHAFPQYELMMKYSLFGNAYVIVDKAHNLLLQTWITVGGLGALTLYAFFAYIVVLAFLWILRQKDADGAFYLRLGLLTGTVAFLTAAMATDSTIGSTSPFFVLLGILAGLNMQTSSKQTEATDIRPPLKSSRKKSNKKS